jgi:hypothetical protein
MAQNGFMANDDVKRFGELLRKKEEVERSAAAAERAEREAAKRLAAALAGKEQAAEALRAARQSGRADRVAEADVGYRAALANLVEVEQGKRPVWAPVAEEAVDAEAPAGESDSTDSADGVSSDAESSGAEAPDAGADSDEEPAAEIAGD